MITYASLSCSGSREINEDYVKIRTENGNGIFVLADGLGGHSKGEVASYLVATTIAEQFDFFDINPEEALINSINRAQEILMEEQMKACEPEGMKTTAVVLLVKENEIHMAHVGDSRGYIFTQKGKIRRTMDHSIPQMLALSGDIKEKEIRNHPERSSLLRVFGIPWEREEYEFQPVIPLSEAKAILLCSDGFWELIDEKRMKSCMFRAETAQVWLDRMRGIVEKNGSGKEMDNYSAIAILKR